MTHEKTFEAINKLKDVELELHRLKNALEMANKALDAQRTWVGLTDEEIEQGCKESWVTEQAFQSAVWWAEAKLKEKNT
jgi:hypothetical protein